ncbi:MAG TPA: hypothetical protein VLD59_14025 [Steroidobacteraceae bacterium]|nr:hypothetical protein [Steroidobacteraceae bacterium]
MSEATSHRVLRTIGIVVTALVVSADGGAVDVTPSGTAGDACTIQCGSGAGVNCSTGWHKAWEDVQEVNAGGEAHSSCEESLCSTWHRCSGMEGDNAETLSTDVSAVTEAIRLGDTNALLALVGNSQNIAINRERSAVQILDCRGGVFAHLAVNGDVLAPVLEALGSD